MSTEKYMVHIPDSNQSDSESESELGAKIKAINTNPNLDSEEKRKLVRDLMLTRRKLTGH